MNDSGKSIKARIPIMIVLFAIAFFVLTGRLIKLQMIDYTKYQQKAIEQQTRNTVIEPKRASIYDRNMKVLAESANVETVFISPVDIRDNKEDVNLIATGLSEILGVNYDRVVELAGKNNYYQTIKRQVEKEEADRLREFINENKLKGIHFAEASKRYYPYSDLASHVIGFVRTDGVGAEGIEAAYNETLTGTAGRIIKAKNAAGSDMDFKYEKYIDATPGNGVVLTIDEVIQHYLEKYLKEGLENAAAAERGVGIVMNVNTGEILAMAVKGRRETYDLNNPRDITDEELKAKIDAETDTQNRAKMLETAQLAIWRNKSIADGYEPGSVFKVITAAMALEEKVVKPTDNFYCAGYSIVGGVRISCWKTAGHGAETFQKGVQNSCNPVFMEIASRVGNKKFYEYIEAFGLKEKTGIELGGEATGYFHSTSIFNEVELATSAFGQTFKVTPIQMITAAAAVVNGGYLMEPHLVKEVIDANNNVVKSVEPVVRRQVVSKETSETMRTLLQSVVSEGTGTNAYIAGYRVGGKTGTSEKRDKLDANGQRSYRIASFLGFAPADDPQIMCLVILDEPNVYPNGGGALAAPVVRNVLEESLTYLGVERKYAEGEQTTKEIAAPDLVGKTLAEAKAVLKDAGIACEPFGDDEKVTSQIPRAGTIMDQKSKIFLYLGENTQTKTVIVPRLIGDTPANARAALLDNNLNIELSGGKMTSGAKVIAQDPMPGTEAPAGSIVKVEFREDNVE